MLKTLLITTAFAGLVASPALAQAPADSAPPSPPAASESAPAAPATTGAAPTSSMGAGSSTTVISAQKPDQWLASKFKGTDVLGTDNEKIGDVGDILFDRQGKVEAIIISVGGFLGVGAKEVAVPPQSFQVVKGENNAADKLKLSMSKDELKSAAHFEPYNPPRTTTGAGGGMAPRPAGSPATTGGTVR